MRTRFTMTQEGAALWVESNRIVAYYKKTSVGLTGTLLLLDGGHEVMVLEGEQQVRDTLDGKILRPETEP
jgi:hypothetical protein